MISTVLVVEKDSALRTYISGLLHEANYFVVEAANGSNAMQNFHKFKPDVALLDDGIPDMDGFDVCRQIKSYRNIPIIFMSDKNSVTDQLQGFASGADDYIIKPFSPRILVARVGALSRRGADPRVEKKRFVVGPLDLDIDQWTLRIDGKEIGLTKIEFEILRLLISAPERVFSRNEMVRTVWGDWYGDTHMIESHISRLRNKVKGMGGPSICKAVRGVGYRLGIEAA